jgi:hypothetical protein
VIDRERQNSRRKREGERERTFHGWANILPLS